MSPERGFVSGIILAAGRSERFGSEPKQLALFEGRPLVERAARTALASTLDEVIIVVGHRMDDVRAAVDHLAVRVVENPDYSRGQSTSIQRGLAAIDSQARAVMMIMADQPLLTTTLLDRLLAAYRDSYRDSGRDFDRDSGAIAVQPAFEGRRGSPVILDRALFRDLNDLRGDVGGRAILRDRTEHVINIPIDDPRQLLDVDCQEDLRQLVLAR